MMMVPSDVNHAETTMVVLEDHLLPDQMKIQHGEEVVLHLEAVVDLVVVEEEIVEDMVIEEVDMETEEAVDMVIEEEEGMATEVVTVVDMVIEAVEDTVIDRVVVDLVIEMEEEEVDMVTVVADMVTAVADTVTAVADTVTVTVEEEVVETGGNVEAVEEIVDASVEVVVTGVVLTVVVMLPVVLVVLQKDVVSTLANEPHLHLYLLQNLKRRKCLKKWKLLLLHLNLNLIPLEELLLPIRQLDLLHLI
mmetsp:Transcript_39138/g.58792  ORF Transcript_39138/g.58792 Transcript_39138/m.58792 type:complete len:249 (+) Transcript_39138:357-1103(+)